MLRRRGAFSVELHRDGPWETTESCVVRTSASSYRRLQESPRHHPGGMSSWGPPAQPPLASGSPPTSGRLLKSESEDSGVEMASNEHSPSTPLGSESSFSLDGFPAKTPLGPGEEAGTEPLQPPGSHLASRKLVQAAQRSRRQRAAGRCPRQLRRHGASPRAQPPREAQELQEASGEHPDGDGAAVAGGGQLAGSHRVPTCPQAVPGQGLKYLEHVCQMLERLARLQQDNRLLRQQAAEAQGSHPATVAPQAPAVWRAERFRPRSCSDSQAPAADLGPCQRPWGHSASSPSLLDPSESRLGAPAGDKAAGSQWGRVKVLLTRLTRRSLRGGRCR